MNRPESRRTNASTDPDEAPAAGHARAPAMGAGAPPTAIERWALRRLLRLAGNPPVHFVLWNSVPLAASDAPPVAQLHVRDRRTLWQLLSNPELRFGDAYSRGDLEVEGDLVECLQAMYRAFPAVSEQSPLYRDIQRWRNRAGLNNTLAGSLNNVHRHYDLGNEFFKRWLDEQMVYTCAYFPVPTLSLEQAQQRKMDYVCRKLRLQPGESVIEAGCGWGALARHMARHYGVRVRAYNISHEQILYARERAAAEGLDTQVEYIEDDYRNIRGRCDAFVSVGMLEHVGAEQLPHLRGRHRCLPGAARQGAVAFHRAQPALPDECLDRAAYLSGFLSAHFARNDDRPGTRRFLGAGR